MKVIILRVGFVYQTTFWYDITRLPLNAKHRNFTLAHPCIIFHDTVDGQYPANQLRLVVSPTIYGVVYIPRGFSEFWTTKSMNPKTWSSHNQIFQFLLVHRIPYEDLMPDPGATGGPECRLQTFWGFEVPFSSLHHFFKSARHNFSGKSENHLTKWSWTKTRHTSCKFKLDIEIKWVWCDLYLYPSYFKFETSTKHPRRSHCFLKPSFQIPFWKTNTFPPQNAHRHTHSFCLLLWANSKKWNIIHQAVLPKIGLSYRRLVEEKHIDLDIRSVPHLTLAARQTQIDQCTTQLSKA